MPGPKSWKTAPPDWICCWRCHRYRDPDDLNADTRDCAKDCSSLAAAYRIASCKPPPKRMRADAM